MNFVLASTSPRRKELFKYIVNDFECVAPKFDEQSVKIKNAKQKSMFLSCQKCKAVLNECNKNSVIIASDTVVEFNGNILEKPKDKQDAYRMIKNLSGNKHDVHTAVTVYYSGKLYTFCQTATVYFDFIREKDIENYIDTNIWQGKAGAYGIQDAFGACHIKGIKGDYYTVMGLPVNRLHAILRKLEILDT